MFGLNSQQVYRDEVGDLNNRRTDIEFDLGDYARQGWGALFGKDYSKEALLREAAAVKNQQLTDAYGGRAQAAAQNLGPLNATYKGPGTLTEAEIQAQIKGDETRGATLVSAQASNPYLDVGSIDPNANAGAIAAASSKQQKTGLESDRRARVKETQTREDALTERMNIREDRRDARAALERAETRKDNLELRRDNMNLEYARLSQLDRQKAQDRKDKAFMMLLQGLGNLGQAFTL